MKRIIVFHIAGGIGKSIAATAVCKAVKKAHPDSTLIVLTAYPDVFLNNPNVDRVFNPALLSYFYTDYIEGNDVTLMFADPYTDTRFMGEKNHLIKVWCEMFGIPYHGEQPEIFITNREEEFNKKKFASDKPIMVVQANGGGVNQPQKYSWARDIPTETVSAVVRLFSQKYNIAVIRREDQMEYEGTLNIIDGDFRSIVCLIKMSEKRLLIDSFAQHAAAALNLPSTVLWIATKPSVFGYDVHDNIQCNSFTAKPELKSSFLQKFEWLGNPLQFPFNSESEIFDLSKILTSLGYKEPEEKDSKFPPLKAVKPEKVGLKKKSTKPAKS